MRGATFVSLLGALALASCTSEMADEPLPQVERPVDLPAEPPQPPPPEPPLVVTYPLACPALYDDGVLPTFEVEISDADWSAIQQEFLDGMEVYHPIVFRHGDAVVRDAMMRLRGNNSRCGDKLQFAISFNQLDPAGRFHGLRRIDLDHAGCRMMEERLALSFMRDLGVPAPCANHARLVVNGRYYGLFVNLEHVNKDFLKRNFGRDDEGNLYKSGDELRTNEAQNDLSRLIAWRAAGDAAEVDALADLDEAVLEWAAEAVLPARDNYWHHGWNYYLYDHPSRGFLFVPFDLDQAFPGSTGATLSLWPRALQHPADVVLADAAWRARFEESVRRAVAAYDVAAFDARLDRWWAQIADAAAADPFFVYTDARVRTLKSQVRARADWLAGVVDDLASR